MAWKLTIKPPGGSVVDQTAYVRQADRVTVNLACNERSTATFSLHTLVPAKLSEVVIYAVDGTTPIFGGIIISRELRHITPGSTQVIVKVDCVDFGTYADWCFANKEYTVAPTLLTVLQNLMTDKLSAYSLTLDTAHVPSVTLATFKWTNQQCTAALRELSDRALCVFNWTPLKVLSFITPGGVAAPVSVTDASTGWRELRIKDDTAPPATRIRLTCGPSSGAYLYNGRRTVVGAETSWTYDLLGSSGPWVVSVYRGGALQWYCTSGLAPGDGSMYWWEPATSTLHWNAGSWHQAGDVLEIQYWVNYPFEVVSDSLNTPVVEVLASAEGALTFDQGKELADKALAVAIAPPRSVSLVSFVSGWAPGQLLTVTLSSFGFSTTAIVSEVRITLVESLWQYNIAAIEGSVLANSFQDRWRSLLGTGTGGGSSSGVSIGGGGAGGAVVLHAHLGGSRSELLYTASALPIVGWQTFTCPTTGSYTFRTEMCVESGGTVQTQLYDLTAPGVVTGSGSGASASTTWVTTSKVVTLTAGHLYQAQVTGDSATYGVLCGQATVIL